MDEKSKKRLFIAIDLPQDIKESIYERCLIIKDTNLRLISKDNIHITLRFIGDVDDGQIIIVKEALRQTVKKMVSFHFRISNNLSCFPKIEKAKVLFIGIEKREESFLGLSQILEEELCRASFKKETRQYIPHITLARTKNPCNIIDIVKEIRFDLNEEIFCNKVTLFESILRRNGPQYNIIGEYDLKKYK